MNNHDIELPPLVGTLGMLPDHQKTVIEAYGRACALVAINADRKRRGELVAKVRDRGFEVVDGKHVPTVLVEFPVDDWESRDRFAAAVDAPQPAEPVKKKPYAQGSALGEFGIIPMCDQVYE